MVERLSFARCEKAIGVGPFKLLRQNDMAHLNSVGPAHDFDAVGHQTFNIGWEKSCSVA